MIPVMNLKRQYEAIQNKITESALNVLKSGQYIMGAEVENFEQEFAAYCGTKYAVGVGNGTDALVIALRACGVQAGDEVITCAMSFFATAEAIAAVGATPVFVDCTADTYVLDVDKVEEKITKRTKAIIPVHLYGQCVDMDKLCLLAEKYNIKLIEDTAQAAGAEYKGKKAGSMGDAGCISFFPTKNLGCAGDGGIIVTNDEAIYRQCKALRVHGSGKDGLFTYGMQNNVEVKEEAIDFHGNLPKYFNFVIGYNSRLDALQAAILRVKLPYLDGWNQRRAEIAEKYLDGITNPLFVKPFCAEYNKHIYYVFMLTVEKRDEARRYMEEKGIGTGVYFPVPLHLQTVFSDLGYKVGDMPNAEYLADHSLVIPMFPELTEEEIRQVVESVNSYK